MNEKAAEIWLAVTADKKKAGVLAAMGVVLAVLVLRNALSGGPSSARASAGGEVTTIDRVEREAETTALAVLRSAGDRPIVDLPAAGSPGRNLFALDPAHFPEPAESSQSGAAEGEAVSPGGERVDEDGAGAGADARALASGLRLRSTLVGRNPLAVIEVVGGGTPRRVVVRPGQGLEGFEVIRVTTSSVVLEREGVRVELTRSLPE